MRFSSRQWARGGSRRRIRILTAALGLALLGTPSARAQDDLQLRIDKAIRRGATRLRSQLEDVMRRPDRNYPMGNVALPLTAILKSGVSPKDSLVRRAFQMLDEMPLRKTYCVACYIFALDIYWRNRAVADSRGGVTLVKGGARRAQGPVRAKMVELVDWLVGARVKGLGSWHYGPSRGGFDNSNTQFAVLGLQVGLEHGIPVPPEVFEEIANHYMRSQLMDGPAEEHRLTFNPPMDQAYTKSWSGRKVSFQGRPGGWNYQDSQQKPYASMTAAGASNLIVARHALRRLGRLSGKLDRQLQNSIYTGMAWMTRRFDDYLAQRGHAYYSLYSLEKVGDLGDVQLFGGHDWYREGAEMLLGKQERNGGWGNHVNTSFALLFLTRATRAHMHGMAPPTIYTVTKGKEKKNQIGDIVYVDDLEAFISAREFFRFLRDTRKAALVPIGEQVVENFALDRQEELIPYLAQLWIARSDRITKFAKESLGRLTGFKAKTADEYMRVFGQFEKIRELLDNAKRGKAGEGIEEIGKLLNETPSIRLKERLLDVVERRRMLTAVGHLAEELTVANQPYRERVHGILVSLTGQDFRLDEKGRSRQVRETEAARWRDWWSGNGPRIEREQNLRRLVERLNRSAGNTPAQRDELVESIVKEGRGAVPFLLEALERPSFRVEVVFALERISGERLGFLANDWRHWWRGGGG